MCLLASCQSCPSYTQLLSRFEGNSGTLASLYADEETFISEKLRNNFIWMKTFSEEIHLKENFFLKNGY